MLASKGRGGMAALQETEERLRGYGDAKLQDLLVWYNWLVSSKASATEMLDLLVQTAMSVTRDGTANPHERAHPFSYL